jgi:uncharacterized membrane-anchored protein
MTKILTVALILVPNAALACPVCFGESDSPLAQAMNLGILAMLVVVAGVLAGFAFFIVYLMRRAKLADSSRAAASGRSALDGADPQEGIAQC